ncbi:zinc finger and SCAN domain-containing protein 22-like [Penaeus indicus]|uniref:zinc finger and SCAN domain-containing protein 22-like n=1 Tax=Penaeus indicus TaxID=29960 RepID=UPI00300D1D5E
MIHMRVHAKKKPYSCEHMKVHTKEKTFDCDVCSKCVARKRDRVRLVRVHTKEKPHSCDNLSSFKSQCRKGSGASQAPPPALQWDYPVRLKHPARHVHNS